MPDPFEVLGLPLSASEQQIRTRYLELVRRYPPENEPDRFAEIQAAMAAVADPRKWLETRLFEDPHDSLAQLLAEQQQASRQRIPTAQLLSLVRS